MYINIHILNCMSEVIVLVLLDDPKPKKVKTKRFLGFRRELKLYSIFIKSYIGIQSSMAYAHP